MSMYFFPRYFFLSVLFSLHSVLICYIYLPLCPYSLITVLLPHLLYVLLPSYPSVFPPLCPLPLIYVFLPFSLCFFLLYFFSPPFSFLLLFDVQYLKIKNSLFKTVKKNNLKKVKVSFLHSSLNFILKIRRIHWDTYWVCNRATVNSWLMVKSRVLDPDLHWIRIFGVPESGSTSYNSA